MILNLLLIILVLTPKNNSLKIIINITYIMKTIFEYFKNYIFWRNEIKETKELDNKINMKVSLVYDNSTQKIKFFSIRFINLNNNIKYNNYIHRTQDNGRVP